jgi:hypothetical protein
VPRIVVPYDNFSGGDYGRLGPYDAPKNSFSALNMYVTRQGELTVRPGLRDVTPGGVTAGAVTFLAPIISDTVVYFQAGVAKQFSAHSASAQTVTSVGSFGAAAVDYDSIGPNNTYGITSLGAQPLGFSSSAAATGGGVSIAVYQNRIVSARTAGAVLAFSDVGGENGSVAAAGAPDFGHFTATNTLTIGDPNDTVVAIRAQRTHLVIFKTNSIYVLTGDMRNATVRQIARTGGAANALGVQRSRNEMIWYVPSPGMTPWRFDGTKATEVDRIIIPSQANIGGGSVALAALPTEDDAMFILSIDNTGGTTKSYGWLYYNRVWTKHTFAKSFQPFVAGTGYFALEDPGLSPAFGPIPESTLRGFRQITSLTFADTGATPKFYSWSIFDRPGSEIQDLGTFSIPSFSPERAGDDSAAQVAGSVTFPEWHSPSGDDVLVRTVLVDFRAFNTGGSLTNHFDVSVSALRQYNTDGPQASTTQSYDESGSASATGGTVERRAFSFGDQGTGNGFQVALSNVRGVSIQRVTVLAESQSVRGHV